MPDFDLVIIGGGPVGHAAALKGVARGARVALIEATALGGTCLNQGCVPTNFLLEAAHTLERAREFSPELVVSLERLQERKRALLAAMADGITQQLANWGVEVISGRGCFLSRQRRVIADGQGQTREMEFPRAIIATGAKLTPPPLPGLAEAGFLTTEDALSLTEAPPSLAILGAGPLGLEFAQLFASLGSQVSLIEASPRLLPEEDAEVASYLAEALEMAGIELRLGATVEEVTSTPQGKRLTIRQNQGQHQVMVETILVADSRTPNLDGLNLEAAGVGTKDGAIVVDKTLGTTVPGIYAVGDATGGRLLSQKASLQGATAAENALGGRAQAAPETIPRVIYTFPTLAAVGLTEEAARGRGIAVKTGLSPFPANARAATLGERQGLVKVVADARYGEILGVHILGPHAGEIIAPAVLARRLEATVEDLAQSLHAHPTLAEALTEAARQATL